MKIGDKVRYIPMLHGPIHEGEIVDGPFKISTNPYETRSDEGDIKLKKSGAVRRMSEDRLKVINGSDTRSSD